jgi:PAS domain S-box-containing protein
MKNMLEQVEPPVLQEIFTSIIEDADANILLIDEDFRVLSLNSGFYWIFFENYGIELKRGSSILESMQQVNPTLAKRWRSRCMNTLTKGPLKVEETFEIDGRNFYWEIYFKAIQHGDQNIISIFSRDITIRHAYQKRILESEANVRSILNTIEDSIWLVNTNFELIDFNKQFYKTYRQAFGVWLVKGKSIIELIPEHLTDLRAQWQHRYETGLRGRPGKYYDAYWVVDELRTYEIKFYPIVEEGKVTGLTIYSRDVTQQKRTEDILKEQNEELTKINSELDRFVYSASHDLRAPLMSVKGLLNMIKIDPDKNNTENYLHLIETSVNKLDSFISDIIKYSQNERLEIAAKPVNLNELVEESLAALRFMDGAEQVRSITNISSNAIFYSDASRLQMIFNNIISNAVRYRDKWKNNSFIQIDIVADATMASIQFTDNGVGIASEHVENIFKMFYRASYESKGSGLGLYIVKNAVDKLAGKISVHSELGVGTKFLIEIPNLCPLQD